MATVQLVGSHTDGQRLHAAEIKNWRHASGGGGVETHSVSATVTEGDRNITLPAFNYWAPDGAGSLVFVGYAGGIVAVTASHASLPRMDLLTGDSSGNVGMQDGVATAETGNVREAPLPSLDDDEVLFAVVRSPGGQANVLAADIRGRAVTVAPSALFHPAQIQNTELFVAGGGAVLNTSGAWTTSNVAVFTPVRIYRTVTIKRMHLYNGAVASGNFDIGIYDSDSEGKPRTRLTSSGSTAHSGTSAMQTVNVSDVTLSPGLYYVAVNFDNTTAEVRRINAITVADGLLFGMYQQSVGVVTLPATATPVVISATRNAPLVSLDRAA